MIIAIYGRGKELGSIEVFNAFHVNEKYVVDQISGSDR
jgi:hypothetical protein